MLILYGCRASSGIEMAQVGISHVAVCYVKASMAPITCTESGTSICQKDGKSASSGQGLTKFALFSPTIKYLARYLIEGERWEELHTTVFTKD